MDEIRLQAMNYPPGTRIVYLDVKTGRHGGGAPRLMKAHTGSKLSLQMGSISLIHGLTPAWLRLSVSLHTQTPQRAQPARPPTKPRLLRLRLDDP